MYSIQISIVEFISLLSRSIIFIGSNINKKFFYNNSYHSLLNYIIPSVNALIVKLKQCRLIISIEEIKVNNKNNIIIEEVNKQVDNVIPMIPSNLPLMHSKCVKKLTQCSGMGKNGPCQRKKYIYDDSLWFFFQH